MDLTLDASVTPSSDLIMVRMLLRSSLCVGMVVVVVVVVVSELVL